MHQALGNLFALRAKPVFNYCRFTATAERGKLTSGIELARATSQFPACLGICRFILHYDDCMNPFGNLVTTLFALAFCAVSFKIAVSAIFTGIAYGVENAVFPFTSKPFGYFLVLAFWLVMGVGSAWLAWVDIAKKRSDGDGDGNGDEVADTLPMPNRRQPALQSASVTLSRSSCGASKFDQFLQRAKSPSHGIAQPREANDLKWDMPSGKPSSPLPEPLLLYKSRPYAIFLLAALSLFIVGMAYTCFILVGVLGQKLLVLVFVFWFVAYLVMAYLCVCDLRWQGPALEISQYAITDHFHGDRRIPWADIHDVRLTASSQNTLLVLQFANLDKVWEHFGNNNLLHAVWQRIFYNGFEGRLKLTSLSFKRAEVFRVSQAFLRHSKR